MASARRAVVAQVLNSQSAGTAKQMVRHVLRVFRVAKN